MVNESKQFCDAFRFVAPDCEARSALAAAALSTETGPLKGANALIIEALLYLGLYSRKGDKQLMLLNSQIAELAKGKFGLCDDDICTGLLVEARKIIA
jgi:hypothetical protein